jgi:hypothetical protein
MDPFDKLMRASQEEEENAIIRFAVFDLSLTLNIDPNRIQTGLSQMRNRERV